MNKPDWKIKRDKIANAICQMIAEVYELPRWQKPPHDMFRNHLESYMKIYINDFKEFVEALERKDRQEP